MIGPASDGPTRPALRWESPLSSCLSYSHSPGDQLLQQVNDIHPYAFGPAYRRSRTLRADVHETVTDAAIPDTGFS
mgnify:CR=1 FL=1